MAAQFDFYADIKRQLERLKEQLIDPNKALLGGQKLMKWIGAQGVAVSQQAFIKQELGDIKWQPRYPNQEEPKFNYAGALMDWKSGRAAPKPNRFQDRPAVIDEGMRGGIQGSLTSRVTGPLAVRWGTGKNYARLQHDGGFTSIPFDTATRDRMFAWLYKSSGPGSVTGFVTGRAGSSYTMSGGRTTRNKAAGPIHTPGLQPTSIATVYVSKSVAAELSSAYAVGGVPSAKRPQLTLDASGSTITMVRWYGRSPTGQTFAYMAKKTFHASKSPAVGLHPVEFFSRGSFHIGSQITQLTYKRTVARHKVKQMHYRSIKVSGKSTSTAAYAKHVHTLANSFPQWDQMVIPRPFVGITDTLEQDIKASVKMYFDKFQR